MNDASLSYQLWEYGNHGIWLLALKDVGTESGGPVVFDVDVHLNVCIEFDLPKDEMNPDYWMLLYVKVVFW